MNHRIYGFPKKNPFYGVVTMTHHPVLHFKGSLLNLTVHRDRCGFSNSLGAYILVFIWLTFHHYSSLRFDLRNPLRPSLLGNSFRVSLSYLVSKIVSQFIHLKTGPLASSWAIFWRSSVLNAAEGQTLGAHNFIFFHNPGRWETLVNCMTSNFLTTIQPL